MGRGVEDSSDKLQRKLAKVERKRKQLRWLCILQVLLAVPYVVCVLLPLNPSETEEGSAGRDRSVIVYYQAALGLVWALVGLLGLFAATVRRLQSLALFCTLEIFSTLLSACVNAVLLLLYHLQCQSLMVEQQDPLDPQWLPCDSSAVGLGFSSALLLLLGLTASAALELRFRIQKTGKRSLNWNVKPQRWKERNIRRGASAALRQLTKNDAGEDIADEDSRLKYLGNTRDPRYTERSLLLRFHTLEQGERRLLLLNLRKGYLKQGEWFGTKVYLSQVQSALLSERVAGEDEETGLGQGRVGPETCTTTAGAHGLGSHSAYTEAQHGVQHAAAPSPPPSKATALPLLERLSRCVRCRSLRADAGEGERLYTLTVRAQQHRWARLFGLRTTSQVSELDFATSEERAHFLSFVQALLPPSVVVSGRQEDGPKAADGSPMAPAHVGDLASSAASPDRGSPVAGPHVPSLAIARPPSAPSSPHAFAEPAQPVRTELLTLLVGTWNMGDAPAPPNLDGWLPRDAFDLYAVATQECPDEHWPLAVESHLGANYVRVTERRMGGIVLLLFTHRKHASKISAVETSFTPTGVLGVGTNKGAVGLALSLRSLRLCIVNAHLAAHQEKLLQRNLHVQEICRHLRLGLTALDLSTQFHTIWCGDLNYRIERGREEVIKHVRTHAYKLLYAHDQLQAEMRGNNVFYGFAEAELSYPPSYKYVRQQPTAYSRLDRIAQASSATIHRSRSIIPKRYSCSRDKEERCSGSGKVAKDKASSSKDKEGGGGEASLLEVAEQAGPPSTPLRAGATLSESPVRAAPPEVQPLGSSVSAAVGEEFAAPAVPQGVMQRREYDSEKGRVPSWCDRVLWRSPPGPWGLTGDSRAGDCDEITVSDHAPIFTALEIEVPVLPPQPTLHHCTLYISKLSLYRCRPPQRTSSTAACGRPSDNGYTSNPNLTARSACGKGVPLSVAGAKLQNLPANLQASVYLLPLHRLMTHVPIFSTMLAASGTAVSNVVIGPMLAEREYLSTQHLHLRVASLSGSKPSQIGQAAISLVQAAHGAAVDFDVVVERLGVPAGFNLRGQVMIVYTKSLQSWDGYSTNRPPSQANTARHSGRVLERHSFSNSLSRLPAINSFRPVGNPRYEGSARADYGSPTCQGREVRGRDSRPDLESHAESGGSQC